VLNIHMHIFIDKYIYKFILLPSLWGK